MAYYTLQEHGALRVLPVPAGLRELASDLSREVLRAQPSNLFGFAADYMAAMLKARSSAVAAAEAVGYMLDHDVTFGAMLAKRGIGKEDAQRACVVIQSAFRGFCTRRDLRESGALPMIDPVARQYGVTRDVAQCAVARIQAAFRGYMVRKILHHQQGSAEAWLADDFPRFKIIQYLLRTVGPEVANKAATKIQAVFRGHMVRQALEQSLYEEVRREVWAKRRDGAGKGSQAAAKAYSMMGPEEIIEIEMEGDEQPIDLSAVKAFDEFGAVAEDERISEGEEMHGEQEEEEFPEQQVEKEEIEAEKGEEEEVEGPKRGKEQFAQLKTSDIPGRPSALKQEEREHVGEEEEGEEEQEREII